MTLASIFSEIKRISLFDKLFPMVLVFFLALGQALGMESAESSELYPNVKRVTNFYVGKIKDRNLWVVMERIYNSDILSYWLQYIGVQYANYNLGRTLPGNDGKAIMPGFSKDGSEHFLMVLKDAAIGFKSRTDEVWVAYVTTDPNPEPINGYKNTHIKHYDISYLPRNRNYDRNKFPGNVLMYVTITSSPNALITSHMGVSVSLEGIEQRKDGIGDRISMDLHSFAAKVMLMRNPNRKYMINAPVESMEKLIAQGLPSGSFFAGTREMKEKIDKAKKITFDEFKSQHINMQELEIEYRERLERIVLGWNNQIKYLKEDHSKNRIAKDKYEADLNRIVTRAKDLLLNINEDHSLTITENSIAHYISEIIKKRYEDTQPTYSFTGWPGAETIDNLMQKYPPLLSVDGPDAISIRNRMMIFDRNDPTRPWLTVEMGDPNYSWIFSHPFAPAGQTHYIVADLKSMADSKQLDPIN